MLQRTSLTLNFVHYMANQFFRKRSPREHFAPAFDTGTLVTVQDEDGNVAMSIKPFEDNGLTADDFSIKSQLASGKLLDPVSIDSLNFKQIDAVNNVQLSVNNE